MILALTSCKGKNDVNENVQLNGQEVLDSAVIQQTKDSRKLWELAAARIEVNDSVTRVYNFRIKFFGQGDSVVSVLSADSGRLDNLSGDMMAMGRVVVNTVDGSTLETTALNWSNDQELIYTDSAVTITDTTGRVLKGIGLESDPQLRHVKIKSEVEGYEIH